jgi:hypothetical protein|tara:strand:+ start:5655 stop:5897 length:243 start_codon:yes stop_codon:yes gene_type:complete
MNWYKIAQGGNVPGQGENASLSAPAVPGEGEGPSVADNLPFTVRNKMTNDTYAIHAISPEDAVTRISHDHNIDPKLLEEI